MKKLLTLLALFAMLFASCSDDDPWFELSGNESEGLVIENGTYSFNFGYEGNTYTLNTKGDASWTVEISSGSAKWLSVSPMSGKGAATITVTAQENTEHSAQSATLTIKSSGADDITIKVNQQRRPETVGLYILSEGGWGNNNSELAYYDIAADKLSTKIFEANNQKKLGDTGNDLAIYGSKMYCVVSGKDVESGGGHIEVIDPATAKSIKRIPFKDASGNADMPRRITFDKDKAYITAFSGAVARLDTASLTLDGHAKLIQTHSEGIAKYSDKLYICNSGYGSGTTISVVDIPSFKETKTITVPQNPVNIVASKNGEIYFSTSSVYTPVSAPSRLHSYDVNTGKVTSYEANFGKLALGKDYLYAIETNFSTYGTYAKKFNLKTKETSDFTTSLSAYFSGYSVSVNPVDGSIYALGMGQDVAWLKEDGTLIKSMKVGVGSGNNAVPVFK